ncbi:MAG: iron-sulfur cluster repair di-iron protein [Balneolaceae bacterium]
MNPTNQPIQPDTSVGEIVARNYHAAGVFREAGLDFCCCGGISLKAACEKRNLDLNEMLERLEKIGKSDTSGDENYIAWEPGHLIDHIESTHHRFVRTKTEEIGAYAAKVARVHGERHPENVEIYHRFMELSQELLQHLKSEEEIVFPLIREVWKMRMSGEKVYREVIDELENQLALMEEEHEGAGSEMAEIRKLSNTYTPPAEACATYRILYQNLAGFEQDLHKHVHLENNILFKKAEKLISG